MSLLACGWAALHVPLAAETLLYTLEIPDARSVRYEVELDVRHPGTLSVRADWTGPRPLAFRLAPADGAGVVVRRSGVSPLSLETEIDAATAAAGPWILSINALPTSGAGAGRVRIELPDAVPTSTPEAAPPPSEPVEPVPDWARPGRTPRGAPLAWRALFDDVERLRVMLFGDGAESIPDSCLWQDDLLRYLAERREALVSGGLELSGPTRELLREIAGTIDDVDELRASDDPAIAGPPPDDPRRRAVWLRARRERLRVLESRLDETLESLRRDHAPELSEEVWPVRLVSCVTACQRHFEERGRVGRDRAVNRDLARAQWDRIVAAGQALDSLATVVPGRLTAGSPR